MRRFLGDFAPALLERFRLGGMSDRCPFCGSLRRRNDYAEEDDGFGGIISEAPDNQVTLDELAWFELAEDGRIQRMRQYFDTAALLKQLK